MTERFKEGDEIKYPNPNADMDGSPETLTRTLDAHDAAIVNAALEPTYCAECAENGLVLPHPCPRVTVAPLAAAPLAEKRLSKPKPVAGVARDPDAADFLTEYRTPLADETDCAEVGEQLHVAVDSTWSKGAVEFLGMDIEVDPSLPPGTFEFRAGQKGRSDCGEVVAGELVKDLTGVTVIGGTRAMSKAIDMVIEKIERGDYATDPASPDLVAAARDTLLSVGGDLDPKPEKWYATIGRREFNRLATALQNTPEPDESEAVKPDVDETVLELLRWCGGITVEEGDDELIYVANDEPKRRYLAAGDDFTEAAQKALAAASNTPEVDNAE